MSDQDVPAPRADPGALQAEDLVRDKFKDKTDSKPWLDMLAGAEKVFEPWNDVCDNIDKEYANIERLRSRSGDREFQIFYANLEVLRPAIYARPPAPVVVPRFKDRKPLLRESSELLERALIANAEQENSHRHYLASRDDLARCSRGVLWARYKTSARGVELAGLEHVNRRDFLHEPARSWPEVGWVARRAWLTLDRGLKRFGDVYKKVALSETRTNTPDEYAFEKKGEVWEIWNKDLGVVCWVSKECDEVLDIQPPKFEFEGFFPCPEPAYGTKEPDSLVPVPDYLFYQDQIEEINVLTSRISALCDALRLKGFYPSGAESISDAIEKALKSNADGPLLVPVPATAAMGMDNLERAIVWLPLEMVAATIRELIQNRKQLIEDVYQITGISDIMRGDTAASETATAQRIKSQYGSVRVRERQGEMVRLCRDGTALQGEIIAEHFSADTLVSMTQTELPGEAQLAAQVDQIAQQIRNLAALASQAPLEQRPAVKQQADQQAGVLQQQIEELRAAPTVEKVVAFLRDQRLRPFALDIETDSTIQPDEDAEKQRRTEFVQMVGGLVNNSLALLQAAPEAGDFIGEVLQFASAPFRAGRQLEGAIDDLVEKIRARAAQPQPQDGEGNAAADKMALQIEQLRGQAETQKAQHGVQMQQLEAEAKQRQAAAADRELALKAQMQKAEQDHAARLAAMSEQMKGMDLRMKELDVTIKELSVAGAEASAASAEARAAQAARPPAPNGAGQ